MQYYIATSIAIMFVRIVLYIMACILE